METKIWIYIGIGAGCFSFLSLIVITIYVATYRSKQRRQYEESLYEEEIFQRYRKGPPCSSRSSSFSASCSTYDKLNEAAFDVLTATAIPIDSTTIEFHLPQPPSNKAQMLSDPEVLGKLDPNIYKRGLTSEQYAIAHSSHVHLGWIEFSTTFDSSTKSLMVSVFRVTDLSVRKLPDGRQEKRNVFVSIYLYPDNIPHQTKVKKNTLTPVFNECFVFKLPHSDFSFANRSLILSTYDQDKNHIRYSLGHVQVNLSDQDMSLEQSHKLGLEFYSQISGSSQIGEIELELIYIPDKGKLRLEVVQCRELVYFLPDDNKNNIFVRLNMMNGTKITKTRDTAVQPLTPAPIFQEILSFSMSERHLDNNYVTVSVMRRYSRTNIVSLGRVTLGPFMYAKQEGLSHWRQMLDSPNESVKMWHPLKSPETEIVK